jgi:tetratricopeptide (TPR) repeat protein
MMMTIKPLNKRALAAVFASCLLLVGVQSAWAQVAPSAASQTYGIHEDLLKCYLGLGRTAETEAEYRWLLAARPSTALLHYNYAVLLKNSGKKAPAAAEYEKAAMYEGSNVDYVGQAGQMLMYMGNYTKAYQYLGKAMQMPGGEKYKASCDGCRDYLQAQANAAASRAALKGGPKGSSGGATKGKPKDDDDD